MGRAAVIAGGTTHPSVVVRCRARSSPKNSHHASTLARSTVVGASRSMRSVISCAMTSSFTVRRRSTSHGAGGDATVDVDDLSAHVAGIVAAQEPHDIGDVLRRADPRHRHAPGPFLGPLALVIGRGSLAHDESGADGVGP